MNEFASGVYGKVYNDGAGYVYKVFYTENKTNEHGWLREIIALKNLSHPNVISPKFIGMNFTTDPDVTPKTNLYIRLKKYEQLLKIRKPLCDLDILQAILDLFNGIAYMHSRFIMHRDIKEANLLYEPSTDQDRQIGKLIICDFSLARFIINTDDIKYFNYLTPETITSSHRAPEVFQSIRSNAIKGIRKSKIEYNEKVDVWSAGIAMFFLLTGLQLYNTIFVFEKHNEQLLNFISSSPGLQNLNKKWGSDECNKIYSELLLSDMAIPFIQSLLDKYINSNLKYQQFYKDIFNLCISDAHVRPNAIDMTNKISKFLLYNDLSHLIKDYEFIGTEIPKPLFTKTKETERFIQLLMEEPLVKLKSQGVRSLILNKITLIMDVFCTNMGKKINEISNKYTIAAAHIIETMFLYDDIFTPHFRTNRNEMYKFVNEIMIGTNFLEGLF